MTIKIDPCTFTGLTKLETIYFGDNQIKEIDPRLFNGLTELKKNGFWC